MNEPLHKILELHNLSHGSSNFRNYLPTLISSNLKQEFGLRPYQQEAFGRFVYFWNEFPKKPQNSPVQLLFHMATGSGKTLIMAGLILYLYEKGFRNFLFFVNSNNIIEKTRNNFLDTNSSKYLFADTISFGDKKIVIKEVDNFQAGNAEDINLVFSTIQGLHARLNTPKENSLTYEDFEDQNIVLISDEAHHINAETKKSTLGAEEQANLLSWESTVNRIFHANPDNLLLEFTATADFSVPEIENKYRDKIIFDYSLRQFRQDGYSKEVTVLQSDLPSFERALQAILLSQYRRKIFEKYGQAIKPVILFKSKTIKESQAFLDEFIQGIKSLTIHDLIKIRGTNLKGSLHNLFSYLEENKITLENFVLELQEDFSKEKLISVNSKDESEEKQIAVNSLEDEANEYRAVFAVDKLNEGWDVLNLFDIVRLYNTRDVSKGKPGKTTMAEAQLIGRGARYCPFKISDSQEFYKRKFDDDLTNELRICEELFYHSAYNPRYIQELNEALTDIGMKEADGIEREVKVKETFQQTEFYKEGVIFLNRQLKKSRKNAIGLSDEIRNRIYQVELKSGYSNAIAIFSEHLDHNNQPSKRKMNLSDLGEHILRKACNKLVFYEFSNLKGHFPKLNSISEFITSNDYLGRIRFTISGGAEQIQSPSPKEKLASAIKVLEDISLQIKAGDREFTGSPEFTTFPLRDLLKDKTLHYSSSQKVINISAIDLSRKAWYVLEDFYGSIEEEKFIEIFDKNYETLSSKYEKIFLLKNERFFRVYEFENGQSIYPDFVLFLHDPKEEKYFQIFINVGENQQGEPYATFVQKLNTVIQPKINLENKIMIIRGITISRNQQGESEFESELAKITSQKV